MGSHFDQTVSEWLYVYIIVCVCVRVCVCVCVCVGEGEVFLKSSVNKMWN